jgi:hypothetical protein
VSFANLRGWFPYSRTLRLGGGISGSFFTSEPGGLFHSLWAEKPEDRRDLQAFVWLTTKLAEGAEFRKLIAPKTPGKQKSEIRISKSETNSKTNKSQIRKIQNTESESRMF